MRPALGDPRRATPSWNEKADGGEGSDVSSAGGPQPGRDPEPAEQVVGSWGARAPAAQAGGERAEPDVAAAQAEAAARSAASLAASLAAAQDAGGEAGNHVVARTSVLNLVVLAVDEGTAEG